MYIRVHVYNVHVYVLIHIYMYISSSRVCEEYLRLFFTLMESSPLPTVRSNALIALADLIVRFPNLIEPWTKNVYAR